MKKRNRAGGFGLFARREKALDALSKRGWRKRKAWTFERLEDRQYFSATPLSPLANLQFVSLSNATAEGAAELWMRELETWIAQAGGNAADIEIMGFALPNDPLLSNQWHILNTGQSVGNPDYQTIYGVAGEDLNVVPVWNEGYTGAGVIVGVIDSGVQLFHPDLIDNLHPTLRFNAITGTNNPSPNLFYPGAPHGTAVAGIIGATANNGLGGSGVAPGVEIAPILLLGTNTTSATIEAALRYGIDQIDVTNNSWGPAAARVAVTQDANVMQALRDSIFFGRDGLGVIHVFSSGNGAGPSFSPGFESIGNYGSSAYYQLNSSRYVISVTGVDHDGLYANVDGTFTAYPEAGPNVLVAAPTGSNAALAIGEDGGLGSGIWTTDLVDDEGYNSDPLPSGADIDRDFSTDPDFTSRFNGTSAAAPMVTGVIALMLEATDPDGTGPLESPLSYRDIQEILVRSARQNAQFEIPASGALTSSNSTWQTNQTGPFRDPDPWDFAAPPIPFEAIFNPLADPNIEGFPRFNHFESQPGLLTNGAGYTVSQGYGVYSEQIGYGHGVIDADLAVTLAEQWVAQGQLRSPEEKTFSTFVLQPALNLPAAERMPLELGGMLVPGGLGGAIGGGFIDYWNEYFADDDPADPDDGPFSGDDPPDNTRGAQFIDFHVPDGLDSAMNIEHIEVKIDIRGPAEDLDYLRIMLVSPDGTQHELNHYYADPEHLPFSLQAISAPAGAIDAAGDLDVDGGNFTWTYTSNRSWGERHDDQVIIDPTTGEPLMAKDFSGADTFALERGWELHVENWSTTEYVLDGLEITWHGDPIATGTQRVQGFVGIDQNGDNQFNYQRSIQTIADPDGDPLTTRTTDVVRSLDLTQEDFAANQMVEAYRVVGGVAEATPVAKFITGADGNYYFDLVPGDYEIRVIDPLSRDFLDDSITPDGYLQDYRSVWRINSDWFFAADREDPSLTTREIGEIIYDDATDAPQKFLDGFGQPVAMGAKNINFLLKEDAQTPEVVVNGRVYADLNANGIFDGDDSAAGGVFVYVDANRNGAFDAGENRVTSSEDADPLLRGTYQLVIPTTAVGTFAIGVIPPSVDWMPTNPDDAVQDLFAGPGDVVNNFNFFLQPPSSSIPDPNENAPGDILGVIYNDRNENGSRQAGEEGVAGFRVYVDANENGQFDNEEISSVTDANGSYFLANVPPGLTRIDVVVPNPGDPVNPDNPWELTSPAQGFREVPLVAGGVVKSVLFGIKNLATGDWGDLAGYPTTSAQNGPSHEITEGFHLGTGVDGETDGKPRANADGDDTSAADDEDGVVIVTNGGALQGGANTIRVTVAGVGGLLQGWMDFNNDGDWDDAGEQIFNNLDLNPGTHNLVVNAPENLANGTVASRFRWGTPNLSYTGPSPLGEVEDYRFVAAAPIVQLAGDYDTNGVVDAADYTVWKSTFGSTTDLRADGNSDGMIGSADYTVWRDNLGATGSSAVAGGATVSGQSGSGQNAGQQSAAPSIMGWYFPEDPEIQAFLEKWGWADQLAALEAAGVRQRVYNASPSTATGTGSGTGGSAIADGTGAGGSAGDVAPFTGTTANSLGLASLNYTSTFGIGADESPILSQAVASDSSLSANLELLDDVLAQFADEDDEIEAGPLRSESAEEDLSYSDLAVAAVFDADTEWWNLG